MQEELEQSNIVFTKPVSEMSDEEKSFYYFKLHDMDHNDALDGLELIQAAMHQSPEHNHHVQDNTIDNMPSITDAHDQWAHVIGITSTLCIYSNYWIIFNAIYTSA